MSKIRTKDDEWYQKKMADIDKVKYVCKCSHRVIIPTWADRTLCDWCGKYVYKDKETEFKYMMKGAINSVKAKEN